MRHTFPHTMLSVLAGPLIWALHFLLIYVFNGIVCARPGPQDAWMGIALSSWAIIAFGLAALAAMALIHLRQRRRLPQAGDPRFLPWLAGALSLLSAVTIVWETIPVLFMPPCG